MITIIKSGYEKILTLFYKDKRAQLHLREIARQTKLHEPSVTRFLRNLEHEHILKSKKDGNLKKYFIQHNKKTYSVLVVFDVARQEKLPELRKNAVDRYIQALNEKPVFALLFGSTAKETYTDESDIDILLVVNKKIKTEAAEQETQALTGMKVSTFQITYSDFIRELRLKDDKVVQSAIYSGYPVLNHIFYYEVLYNERI